MSYASLAQRLAQEKEKVVLRQLGGSLLFGKGYFLRVRKFLIFWTVLIFIICDTVLSEKILEKEILPNEWLYTQ